MDRLLGRSRSVEDTLVMPLPAAPEDAAARFESLYRATRNDVFAYVATLLGDRAAAEDVTATAFERAYRKRASFSARRGTPRAWLFGIARNAALDELRRRGRSRPLTAEPEAPSDPPPDDPEQALRRTVVGRALAELEPRELELIALKFHAGLSNAELARVIGTSESNAGTKLHRTIEKLREACR
jgi:RNA polymerase sigma-70 factor, ECF subfamily